MLREKHVYFAQCDFGGPVKIGCSYGIPERILCLQNDFPFRLIRIGSVKGGHFIERFLHAWFRDQQIRGEWFGPNAELWRAAMEARTTGRIHFLPPDLPHRYALRLGAPSSLQSHYGISESDLACAMGCAESTVRSIHKEEYTKNLNYLAALAVLKIRNGHPPDFLDRMQQLKDAA